MKKEEFLTADFPKHFKNNDNLNSFINEWDFKQFCVFLKITESFPYFHDWVYWAHPWSPRNTVVGMWETLPLMPRSLINSLC